MCNVSKYVSAYRIVVCILVGMIFVCADKGCRFLRVNPDVSDPKQGDLIKVTIDAGPASDLNRVEYAIGGQQGVTTTVPRVITVDTYKGTGKYYTALDIWGKATFNDSGVLNVANKYDLTVGKLSRQDADRTYAIYVAKEPDDGLRDRMIDMANAFMDEFDALDQAQYYWSEPRFYTSDCLGFANSVDLAISFGHGNHHCYRAGDSGGDLVDLSQTCYGSCAPRHATGDAEYLVFASCQTLSLADFGGSPFWDCWRNTSGSKLLCRPFTGLHGVLGFRTNFVVHGYWAFGWHHDGDDLFEAFAHKLDAGASVVDSWLDAVGDELDLADDENLGTAIYLPEYESDAIGTGKDDYIYGNGKYSFVAEYWEME